MGTSLEVPNSYRRRNRSCTEMNLSKIWLNGHVWERLRHYWVLWVATCSSFRPCNCSFEQQTTCMCTYMYLHVQLCRALLHVVSYMYVLCSTNDFKWHSQYMVKYIATLFLPWHSRVCSGAWCRLASLGPVWTQSSHHHALHNATIVQMKGLEPKWSNPIKLLQYQVGYLLRYPLQCDTTCMTPS